MPKWIGTVPERAGTAIFLEPSMNAWLLVGLALALVDRTALSSRTAPGALTPDAALLAETSGRFDPYGTACPGPAGTPDIQAVAAMPILGSEFGVRGTDLGPQRVALLFVGASDSVWHGVPLPADLTPVGMPGCTLLTSIEVMLVALVHDDQAEWQIFIPPEPRLLGASFFAQAMALDSRANAFGAVLSAGRQATIGNE